MRRHTTEERERFGSKVMVNRDSNSTELKGAIEQARRLSVESTYAQSQAEELVRWGNLAIPSSRPWWLSFAFATVTAAVLVVGWFAATAQVTPTQVSGDTNVVQLGDRVTIVASAGAQYTIALSNKNQTEIELTRGAVTARLHKGEQEHLLRLSTVDLEAVATGTTYTIFIDESGKAHAIVHEGEVQVSDAQGKHVVEAGASWPPLENGTDLHAVAALMLSTSDLRPTTHRSVPQAAPEPDAAMGVYDAGPTAKRPEPINHVALWRRARLLRGQGRFQESLQVLDSLVARRDVVWAPIAAVEAMRIHGRVLSNPKAVLRLGNAFLTRHPKHELAEEAEELLCRAHTQVGTKPLPLSCVREP